jgi:uncharacterized protein YidB (DUF937 family)
MSSILDSVMGLLGGRVSPQMMDSVKGLLREDSPIGGLSGLLQKAQAAGLGSKTSSWVGKGSNAKVSPEETKNLLGGDQIAAIAGKLGISPEKAARQISAILPKLVDQLTPDGKVPDKV